MCPGAAFQTFTRDLRHHTESRLHKACCQRNQERTQYYLNAKSKPGISTGIHVNLHRSRSPDAM